MKSINYFLYFVFVLLGAHSSNARWLCENGLSGDKSVSFDSQTIQNSRVCIFKGFTISKGDYYFELKVEGSDENVEVGVTTDDALNGPPFKGLFYGNHLSDGSSVLRKDFGQPVNYKEPADYIGVIIKIKDDKLNLYLIHGGVPLGLAFSIDNPRQTLFPAIILKGTGKVTFEEKTLTAQVPLERSKNILRASFKFTSFTEFDKIVEKPECWDNTIEFRQFFFAHSSDLDEEFQVSFNYGKREGILFEADGKWWYHKEETNAGVGGSEDFPCVQFVEQVLDHVKSFKHTDSKVVVEAQFKNFGNASFQAAKFKDLIPETVTKNVFEDINLNNL